MNHCEICDTPIDEGLFCSNCDTFNNRLAKKIKDNGKKSAKERHEHLSYNEQNFDQEKYNEYVKQNEECNNDPEDGVYAVPPRDRLKLNLGKLFAYCDEKGLDIEELSHEEKMQFKIEKEWGV